MCFLHNNQFLPLFRTKFPLFLLNTCNKPLLLSVSPHRQSTGGFPSSPCSPARRRHRLFCSRSRNVAMMMMKLLAAAVDRYSVAAAKQAEGSFESACYKQFNFNFILSAADLSTVAVAEFRTRLRTSSALPHSFSLWCQLVYCNESAIFH